MSALPVATMEEVRHAMRTHPRVRISGARTKAPLLSMARADATLDMTQLAGIVEYDPAEYTCTALAGTRLRDIHNVLADHDQYMPFDPPFVDAGATLGGTIAAGINGPCRLRGGGIRDFVIGIRFVDGTGELIRGGGRVVKNAAGFDLPRLMVGSMGSLGVLCEATIKVFPMPAASSTLRIVCDDFDDAVARMHSLAAQPFELDALDLEPPATLVLRVGGHPDSLAHHARRVGQHLASDFETLTGDADAAYWRAQREFAWLEPDHWLIRVPLQPRQLPELETHLGRAGITRRYSVAGNLAWLTWPAARSIADLAIGDLTGQIVRGPQRAEGPFVGARRDFLAGAFGRRIVSALNPESRLPALQAD